jgi:hypothetical protein
LSVSHGTIVVSCTVPTPFVHASALVTVRHGTRLVGSVRGRLRDHRVTVRLQAAGRLRGKGRTSVTLTVGAAKHPTVLDARIAGA